MQLCGSIKPQFSCNLMSYIPKRPRYFLSHPGRRVPLVFCNTCMHSGHRADCTRCMFLFSACRFLHALFLIPTLARVLTAPNAGSKSSIQRCERLPWKLPSRPLPADGGCGHCRSRSVRQCCQATGHMAFPSNNTAAGTCQSS